MKLLQSAKDYIKGLGTETYTREELTPEQDMEEKYNRFSPELRKMIEAMAYRESMNGKVRVNPGDQKDGSHSYGLLHMGQGALDQWAKLSGEKLKAKDLAGPESDAKQKFIQASRIDRDMRVNKRDLRGATRYIQNYGEPNYATSSMNNYEAFLKRKQEQNPLTQLIPNPNAVSQVQ